MLCCICAGSSRLLKINYVNTLFSVYLSLISLPALAGGSGAPVAVSAPTRCELTPFDATAIGPALDVFNRERAAHGMGALSEDPALTEAANQQAREMALQGQLTHVDDKGGTFVERAIGAQYSGQPRAENLAWQQKSATHAATAWLNSPAHQHNILLPDVDDAGFGYACNPETGRFWVLVLGRRGQALLGAR